MRFSVLVACIVFALPASLLAEESPSCIPVPSDYKVLITIKEGSILSMFDVLACAGNMVPVFFDKSLDHPITVNSRKPGRFPDAVAVVNKELSHSGWKLSMSGTRLLLERYKAIADWAALTPGNISKGKQVRLVIQSHEKVVEITTEGRDVPSRNILHASNAVLRVDDGNFVLSKELRALAAQDPLAFVNEAGAAPTVMGLMPNGFLLSFVRPGGIVEQMGLKEGDILVSVNDIRLVRLTDAFAAYAALRSADKVILRLLRKGSPLAKVYEFR